MARDAVGSNLLKSLFSLAPVPCHRPSSELESERFLKVIQINKSPKPPTQVFPGLVNSG